MPRSILSTATVMLTLCLCGTEANAQSLFGGSTGGAGGGTNRATGTNRGSGATGGVGGTALNLGAGTGPVDTNFGSGLVGRSDNDGRFVGNQVADQVSNSGGGGRNFGNLGNNAGRAGNARQPQQPVRKFRYRQEIAFDYDLRPRTVVRTSLDRQLSGLQNRIPGASGITIVTAAEGEIELRGRVASDRDRRLVERYVKMEPGVRRVRNELVVDAVRENPPPSR